jgi:hypothetical protein
LLERDVLLESVPTVEAVSAMRQTANPSGREGRVKITETVQVAASSAVTKGV